MKKDIQLVRGSAGGGGGELLLGKFSPGMIRNVWKEEMSVG